MYKSGTISQFSIFITHLSSHFVSRHENWGCFKDVGIDSAEIFSSLLLLLFFCVLVLFFWFPTGLLRSWKVACERWERVCVKACQSHLMHKTFPIPSTHFFLFPSFYSSFLSWWNPRGMLTREGSLYFVETAKVLFGINIPPSTHRLWSNFRSVSVVLIEFSEHDLTLFSSTLSIRCLCYFFRHD